MNSAYVNGIFNPPRKSTPSVLLRTSLLTGTPHLDIAATYLASQDKSARRPRILQFSSEDRYTKYEICELFAQIMGLPLEGMTPNAEGNDPKASVQRPYDCHLSTKALRELGIDVSTQDFVGWWRREARAFRK